MAVTVQINGTTLNPQPASVDWESNIIGGKLDGSEAIGAYEAVTLRAPVDNGGTVNWNWSTYENQTLTSIVLPARFETMKEASGTTYNSGVVSKRIRAIDAPPGGLVRGVEMRVLVVI
jgi:hypothetical protein